MLGVRAGKHKEKGVNVNVKMAWPISKWLVLKMSQKYL